MEKLYQYLWKLKMFGRPLRDADGKTVTVIDPGRLNSDSGPDFFNSKIMIGDTRWVGNVEIHVRASDWMRHGHDSDPAYDSVILHAVGLSDKRITRTDGSLIPQVELTMPPEFFAAYSSLCENLSAPGCAGVIPTIPPLTISAWIETLAVERIQAKASRVAELIKTSAGDWEQACFVTLARALGFSLNGEPFEMLARSIPLRILHHHSDNPLQIEAILFGQAGMLDSSCHILDEYYQLLCREYFFLARKYGLRPMRPGLWKYSRTRPQNAPHRRIAFLAALCLGGFSLFSKIIKAAPHADSLRALFSKELSGYWASHMAFDTEPRRVPSALSPASVDLLMINAAAPLIYAYASMRDDPDMAEKALDLLASLPPENNSIIRGWNALGLAANDALRSQALVHLRREYCEPRKCLYCRIGHHMLRRAAGTQTASCRLFSAT